MIWAFVFILLNCLAGIGIKKANEAAKLSSYGGTVVGWRTDAPYLKVNIDGHGVKEFKVSQRDYQRDAVKGERVYYFLTKGQAEGCFCDNPLGFLLTLCILAAAIVDLFALVWALHSIPRRR